MSKKITVRCTIYGQCEVEIDPIAVDGMTDKEIGDWVSEGAHIEFWDQGGHDISLHNLADAIKEHRKVYK